jgi:hypothetical protein
MEKLPSAVQTLIDKQAITECLMRYIRGVDRGDTETFRSAYWPDATDDHVGYIGGMDGLVDYVFGRTADMRSHHMMGNLLIEMESETTARCESYVHPYHETAGVFNDEEFVSGARYVDLFEKRGDEWRIKHRTVLVDYYWHRTKTSNWESGRYVKGRSRGEKMPIDRLYTKD